MADLLNRVPPSSQEAEQSILGAMLLSERCVLQAMEKLRAEEFYSQQNRNIYSAMEELASQGKPIDLVTVTERLEQGDRLSLEELTYLTELTQKVPSTSNISVYIDIVKEKALLRKLIDAAGMISDMAFRQELPAREALSAAGDLIYKISDGSDASGLTHIRRYLMESYEMISKVSSAEEGLLGVSTGFKLMDKTLSGLQPNQLIIVAGRPGMGKTSFALNIVEHIGVKVKKPVAFFSLEMSGDQLASRLICSGANVDAQKTRTRGALKSGDFYRLFDALGPLEESSIYIDDTPSIGPTEMLAKLRRLRQDLRGDLGLVVVDYLQLMTMGGRVENRQLEVSMLTRSLKVMARELSVPIMVLSQLSRATEKRENKRPMLSDLRESRSIEQDADVFIFLHRDDYYAEDGATGGKSKIIIAKQRSGPTASIDVTWKGEQTRYIEVDYSREEE